jgi:NDP-sugar pyrophosphorylase family protein
MPASAAGLIVAGGAGERMRCSGSALPKPLVPVAGIPLLEWNLLALLRAGLRDVHVAVSAANGPVRDFARSRCAELAARSGAVVSVIEETQPLGSIGAAAVLAGRGDVIVANADNLTGLDLRAVLAAHRASGAALTLAVHDEPFPIPYGEVTTENGRVVAYREKPTLTVRVCSAVSVLSARAAGAIGPGEAMGLPALANRLLQAGATVQAFHHAAPWIDVNDLAARERAEALVSRFADRFAA